MKLFSLMFVMIFLCFCNVLSQDTSCGIAWGPIINLSGLYPQSFTPHIAAQGETLYVTWKEAQIINGGARRLPFTRSTDGGVTWEPVKDLLADTSQFGPTANDPWILTNQRTIFLLYMEPNSGGISQISMIRSTDAGLTWSAPVPTISDTGGRIYFTAMLGTTIVAGHPRWSNRMIRSTDGGDSWSSPATTLTYGGGNAIALTPGLLHNVYEDYSGTHSLIEIAYKYSGDVGDTWSDSVFLSDLDDEYSDIPALGSTIDDSGRPQLFATWRDGKYGYRTLVGGSIFLRRTNGIKLTPDGFGFIWEPETLMTELANGYNNSISGGQISSAGKKIGVTWTNDELGHINFRFSPDYGKTWSGLCDVTPEGIALEPTCVVSDSAFHLVWEDKFNGYWGIYYRQGKPITTTVKEEQRLPNKVALKQNYPNPFNPKTEISFKLQVSGFTSLKVYDLFGREVAILVTGQLEAGEHHVEWNAGNVASGVYYYRLSIHDNSLGTKTTTKKMILLK